MQGLFLRKTPRVTIFWIEGSSRQFFSRILYFFAAGMPLLLNNRRLSIRYTLFMLIFGIHAVEEALAARGRRFEYVAIASGRGDTRLEKINQLCRASGIPVRTIPRDQLARLAKTASHQGIVAVT